MSSKSVSIQKPGAGPGAMIGNKVVRGEAGTYCLGRPAGEMVFFRCRCGVRLDR